MNSQLLGQIALVAGATRGLGRAIARELAQAGAFVICTGRSTAAQASDLQRPETIDETLSLIHHEGGRGMALRCDHSSLVEVQNLAKTIHEQFGRLDILVNDIWGGDYLTQWVPFDQHNLEYGLELFNRGLFSHMITAHSCARLLKQSPNSIILEITDGITDRYRGSLYYDVVKHAVLRSAQGMASDLHEYGVAVVAVSPGFLRSEAMLDHFGVTESTWTKAVEIDPHFSESETPHFCARCIVALCSESDRMQFSGSALASWNMAVHYGITDVDGRQPHFGRYALDHLGIDLG